jgi:membrane protein DedA with SNARE-associated domain
MDRLLAILMGLTSPWTYLLVFGILLACGLGLPIPEDITLFAAGLISYYGLAHVWWMIVVSLVGVMMGDTIIFLARVALWAPNHAAEVFFENLA